MVWMVIIGIKKTARDRVKAVEPVCLDTASPEELSANSSNSFTSVRAEGLQEKNCPVIRKAVVTPADHKDINKFYTSLSTEIVDKFTLHVARKNWKR